MSFRTSETTRMISPTHGTSVSRASVTPAPVLYTRSAMMKTNTVAVVVPDLENPTFHGVLRGLSRAAARDGYHILIADSAESVAEERILAVETRRRCDGIVLCAPAQRAETGCIGEP